MSRDLPSLSPIWLVAAGELILNGVVVDWVWDGLAVSKPFEVPSWLRMR